MNVGGGDAPPLNGGEFLLQLLRKPANFHPRTSSSTQSFSDDPAVAAMGPSMPTFASSHEPLPSSGHDFPYRLRDYSSPPPFAPHGYFRQNPNPNPNLNPNFSSPPDRFNYGSHLFNLQPDRILLGDHSRKSGFFRDNSNSSLADYQEQNLVFGSLKGITLQTEAGNFPHERLGQRIEHGSSCMGDNMGMNRRPNALLANSDELNVKACGNSTQSMSYVRQSNGNNNKLGMLGKNANHRAVAPPPGFSGKMQTVGSRDYVYEVRISDNNADRIRDNSDDLNRKYRVSNQLESTGVRAGSNLHSVSDFGVEESMLEFHGEDGTNIQELSNGHRMHSDQLRTELDDLEDQLVNSLGIEDESGEKSDKKKNQRDKDYRSDKRGQWIMGQRMRNVKRQMRYRSDIDMLNTPFLAVFESLIPSEDEKVKQKQLLTVLESLVSKEWPEARLYLYGSCANSFGFSKSDIDVCLAMELGNLDKTEVLLKLADILQSNNLQNVQALTRARVPIVKLMDPVTGISCDICINNVLAVVNTKLLRDYARIDERLRQLAFIVKHWAKTRRVNETYHGTLSSYAYVLMCIHFLQQRRPAILPCLQRMEITYFATVDDVECAYFDQVAKLCNYGSQNVESIGQLVWGFFHYWAYCHDYASDVISVRMGCTLSKRAKDWTRRVGNDRHLICIEDPFEVSHDLGRVVDKFSIRVLREEFERAANIMQNDPNPCVTLFEPYIPN